MGWNRVELKLQAKDFLKEYYWRSFLAVLIVTTISVFLEIAFNTENAEFLFVASMLSIGIRIFAINVLEVGLVNYFVRAEKGDVDVSNIFSVFKSNNYLNIVKTMVLRDVFLFLWTLLLIIPGIVKSYEYCFIPYILAENPDLEYKEIFEKTKKMTKGEKLEIFILNLSFFGWYFLGLLLFIIGVIFVVPYHRATEAKLYFALKDKTTSTH